MPDKRPMPNSHAPEINNPLEVLNKLLALELERLDTAVRIEKERKIVFPETSVIIHDIQRLTLAIEGKKRDPAIGNLDLTELLEDLEKSSI